jgi:hypothetical protein
MLRPEYLPRQHADLLTVRHIKTETTSNQPPTNLIAMKNFYFLMFCFLTVILVSCQKEEPEPTKKTGTLHIDVGLDIQVREMPSPLKSTQQTEAFKVIIYRADGTVAMTFETAMEMPDVIELETGDYYVEAHSDNNLPAAFENPYYYGVSDMFTISSNMQQSVQVNCILANTMVSVVYSTVIAESFLDYTTTVSSSLGSLVFLKDETRIGYFQTLPLDILVELTYQKPDGTQSTRTLSGSIPAPLANRHYEIHVDASINEGMATFQILLDESVVQVEVVEITDDSNTQPAGAVGYGDILITEIMYDPSALSDTEGEWFEIYNNSDQAINLQQLVLGRDDGDRHTITDPIELLPGEYFVFARTDLATDASNSYSYGSDISLTNTGAVLAIYNEDTDTGPGALVFSVDYGGTDFPDGSGASISLNPDMTNATDALLGTSWCTSTSAYSTGDLGTPGAVNDPCQ